MKKEVSINITIDKDEYRNTFNKKRLSTDLSNYIYEECKGKPINSDIIITIFPSFNISLEEKEELVDMIRENYGLDVQEDLLFLRRSFVFKIILFLIGIAAVALSYYTQIVFNHITSEVILIIGWVAIWESIYNWIFEDGKKKMEIKRLKKLTKCKIQFKG